MNKKIIKALNNEKEFIKEVLVKPSSPIDRVLFFLGLRRKKKSIELSGLVNAIVYKVASLFAEMSINENSKEAIQQQIYVAMRDNLPLLIDALAYAIHNKQGQPPKWIYDALEYQFTVEETANLAALVYGRLDVSNFFVISELIKGVKLMSILEAEAPSQKSEE